MNVDTSRLLPAAVLATWAAVLAAMFATGRIVAYLHPAFHPYTLAASALLGLGAILVLVGPPLPAGCGPAQPRSRGARIFQFLILVGPLLVAFFGSTSSFSANAIRNRAYVQNVAQLPPSPATEPALPGESPSSAPAELFTGGALPRSATGALQIEVIDLLYAAQLPELRPDFENKTVEFIGQLVPTRGPNPNHDRYDVVRMMMTCCAADAQPVAVTVQTTDRLDIADMTWVKVSGTATFPAGNGTIQPLITPSRLEPTPPPRETLIY